MSAAAASFYVGRTTHARLSPFTHRFTYRVGSILIDIDRLEEAGALSRWFSVDRFNLFSFHRRDHGARRDEPLRAWAEESFASAGVDLDGGPIRLFCLPRVLGYVFNPVSLWFGFGPDERLRGVIYEVNNTFGDTHAYVTPIAPDADPADHRHRAEKVLHVSPFFPVDGGYQFRTRTPDERFSLMIRYSKGDEDALIATHTADRAAITDGSAWRLFFRQPLLTLKVIAGIHFEALRLWRKGARYHARPAAPPARSAATPFGSQADVSVSPQHRASASVRAATPSPS